MSINANKKPGANLPTKGPQPGPDDTKGLIAIFYWKNCKQKSHGFREYYTGQKIPPESLSSTNPPKFCDKYAYERILKQLEKKRGLWDIVVIIDKASDRKIEQHYWSNGIWRQKIYTEYSWELISHRDQRFKIKVNTAPPIPYA